MRVLWVEDQYEDNLPAIREVEERGVEVIPVRTVAEALQALQDEYDRHVVDLKVPLGDGCDLDHTLHNGLYVLDRIRETGRMSQDSAIVYSNFSEESSARLRDYDVTVVRKFGFFGELLDALGLGEDRDEATG